MSSNNLSDRVAKHFRWDWREYDNQIRTAIPFYDKALATLVNVLRASEFSPTQILDLGIGTGNLTSLLLEAFPEARLSGIDIVPDFLEIAEKRLAIHRHRTFLHKIDVADFDFSSTYDLVVSSFMFHHVPDDVKRQSYSRILGCLSPGGVFVNVDFVGSSSQFYSRVFDKIRVDFMRMHGLSKKVIKKQYIDHRKLELPVPLEVQMKWLAKVGFQDVECCWKYLNLAIFLGRKVCK